MTQNTAATTVVEVLETTAATVVTAKMMFAVLKEKAAVAKALNAEVKEYRAQAKALRAAEKMARDSAKETKRVAALARLEKRLAALKAKAVGPVGHKAAKAAKKPGKVVVTTA